MQTAPRDRYPVVVDGETSLIGTANELAITLDVLQGQRDREVLEQLAPHLAQVVATPSGFVLVSKSLAPEDQIYLVSSIGAHLEAILGEARHLRDVLSILSQSAVEQCILNTLGQRGLRRLIQTAQELAEVLEWIYGERDQALLELIGADHVRRIIRSGAELGAVLNSLEEKGQCQLLEMLGWSRVVELVRDGRDLTYLLRALPAAESTRLMDHFPRERLIELIGDPRSWDYMYRRLEPAEEEQLLNRLGVKRDA
jgi:hypothetical protein